MCSWVVAVRTHKEGAVTNTRTNAISNNAGAAAAAAATLPNILLTDEAHQTKTPELSRAKLLPRASSDVAQCCAAAAAAAGAGAAAA